jgi:hypothetical protein
LKQAVNMSFYDTARGWLDAELRRERTAITDKLHSRWRTFSKRRAQG